MKLKRIKIPILMYHEVSSEMNSGKSAYKMTPAYNLTPELFEEHLKLFNENGYESIVFDDIPEPSKDKKYVLITFDDGWKGNYNHVLPLLKKYAFRAVFFVTTNLIGTEGFMTWPQVISLMQEGMSVQSHAMTHKPLQNLTESELYEELHHSKQVIEEHLGHKVSAISFPHGSFDQKVVSVASQAGYKFLCTSEMERTFNTNFIKFPAILGRITVTNHLPLPKLEKLLRFDNREVLKGKLAKTAKNTLKRLIGIENYRKLYRWHFNIEKPSS